MFCAPELVFDGTEGVGAHFHVLRSRTRFGRYRGHQLRFSSFALSDSFTTVPRASGLVFMFLGTILFLGGIEAVGTHFQVLRSQIRFRQYRGRRGSFSCFALTDYFWPVPKPSGSFLSFALPDTFLAVPRPSGLIFKFCAPGYVFDGTEGVGAPFMLCAHGLFLGDTEAVGAHFKVLRS
jgi:hypothetical protein